ncbi:hypothetical protein F5X97DRAFT_322219 [Nemania serpens]|nr:hypothetical protein F5X97DRAFT_322219 [Nemania serpens]
MPMKWDEKAERDLLMAMRIAENGYNSVPKDVWEKTARLMVTMGHEEATWSGISQRWMKTIQKDFQSQYPQAIEVAAATATTAPAPARRPKRKQQAKVEDAAGGDGAAAEKGPAAKKQKK